MSLKLRRGQSLLEYSILFAVIVAAILIMQFYVKRSYQGRLKTEADAVGSQYAPGYTTSNISTDVDSTTTTVTQEGTTTVTINPSTSTYIKDETVDAYNREW